MPCCRRAAAVCASNQNVEVMRHDVTEVMQQTGRAYHDALRAELMPVAGNA